MTSFSLAGSHYFQAMQDQLELAEGYYPRWEARALKFHLEHARFLQMKCEGSPRRYAALLALPEYRQAARRVERLKQEYALWLFRRLALTHTQTHGADRLIERYLATSRRSRLPVLYVERFTSQQAVAAILILPGFQAHEVPFPGLGCPEAWAYIDGQHQERQTFRRTVNDALNRMGVQ